MDSVSHRRYLVLRRWLGSARLLRFGARVLHTMRAGRSRWAGRAAENACLALLPAGTGGDQALEPEPIEARSGTEPPRVFRGLKGALALDILLIPALKVTCATRAMQRTTCNRHGWLAWDS